MFAKIPGCCTLIFFLTFCIVDARAQNAREKAGDNEFIMEIYREPTTVRVVLYFTDATKYSYVVIEKGHLNDGEFRQCAYENLKDNKANGGAIEVRDKYPFSPTEDSYYRIRTVTTDGIERIYPPVRLQITTDECPDGK